MKPLSWILVVFATAFIGFDKWLDHRPYDVGGAIAGTIGFLLVPFLISWAVMKLRKQTWDSFARWYFWLVLILGSLAFAAKQSHAQIEHAPTAEQCMADSRLWMAQLPPDGDSAAMPTVDVLGKRVLEMNACGAAYPNDRNLYYIAGSEMNLVQQLRLYSFLRRHNLMQQFLDEDAAGKR